MKKDKNCAKQAVFIVNYREKKGGIMNVEHSKIDALKDVAAQWAIDFLEGKLSIEDEDYQILHTILVCLLEPEKEE